jgi:hypothetical protein
MQVQNGNFRRKTISVDFKNEAGQSLSGFPKQFNITDAFTQGNNNYSALSNAQFAELSDEDYNTRLAHFLLFIETEVEGLDTTDYEYEEGEEPFGEDIILCPIGE